MFTRMLHAVLATGVSLLLLSSVAANAQFQSLPTARYAPDSLWNWTPACGTPSVDEATAASVRERLRLSENKAFIDGELKIPVAVHLITSGKNGKYPRSVVDLMISNMNVAFSGA
ncbi:MAG: hypothetical protein ABI163_25190, partial [Thermoanaerobaculia bacterium]